MNNTGYTTLSRQSGLMREMRVVANNIANMATTGYRQEGLVFSEYVATVEDGPSVSMAGATAHNTSLVQGALTQTGGRFDLAIEGPGFFLIETPQGQRLTRGGNFAPGPEGDLMTADGYRVLDAGTAPIFIPPDATDLAISADGTISSKGQPLGRIGLFRPSDPLDLTREDGVRFRADSGVEPSDTASILQGYLENSNVDPVGQIARMIEVQRAYEMGQSFLDAENERRREALKTFVK